MRTYNLISEDKKTSIPLKKVYFKKIKDGSKTIHIDKGDYGLEGGDFIRFLNGYDPENGSVIRRVSTIEDKLVRDINLYEMDRASVSVDWLIDYADNLYDKVYLFHIEDPSEYCHFCFRKPILFNFNQDKFFCKNHADFCDVKRGGF